MIGGDKMDLNEKQKTTYEAVSAQIKAAPEACLDEISHIISYVVYRYEQQNEEFNEETKEAIREVEEMEKNPSLGKTYTDVDQMMKELLA